jgi:pyrimidine deaminase RibD-like protein
MTRDKLDHYLLKLARAVVKGQGRDPEHYGMVAAAVLTPGGQCVARINYAKGDLRVHAERAAIEAYTQQHGDIPKGSIIITTLSPCNEEMGERFGDSCTDLIDKVGITHVYYGYRDPTQRDNHNQFESIGTNNQQIKQVCKALADTFLK